MNAPSFERFGPFLLVRLLGRGGMGEVHIARTPWNSPREVAAVKRLRADAHRVPTFADRFQHEAALAVRLQHPRVVGTIDVGSVEGQLYVASELVRGKDAGIIADRLRERSQGAPVAVVIRMLIDILRGLAYVHGVREPDGRWLQLVHRDVTPGNVLIGYDGVARLADFGLAKSALSQGAQWTSHGEILGTPHYLAPEIIRGQKASAASDIYGLGAVTYRILTGVAPFQGTTGEVLLKALTERPRPLLEWRPDLPPWFAEIVHEMLDPDPKRRPFDAGLLVRRVEHEARPRLLLPPTSVGRWLGQLFDTERVVEDEELAAVAALDPIAEPSMSEGTVVLARSGGVSLSSGPDVGRPGDDEFGTELELDSALPQEVARASQGRPGDEETRGEPAPPPHDDETRAEPSSNAWAGRPKAAPASTLPEVGGAWPADDSDRTALETDGLRRGFRGADPNDPAPDPEPGVTQDIDDRTAQDEDRSRTAGPRAAEPEATLLRPHRTVEPFATPGVAVPPERALVEPAGPRGRGVEAVIVEPARLLNRPESMALDRTYLRPGIEGRDPLGLRPEVSRREPEVRSDIVRTDLGRPEVPPRIDLGAQAMRRADGLGVRVDALVPTEPPRLEASALVRVDSTRPPAGRDEATRPIAPIAPIAPAATLTPAAGSPQATGAGAGSRPASASRGWAGAVAGASVAILLGVVLGLALRGAGGHGEREALTDRLNAVRTTILARPGGADTRSAEIFMDAANALLGGDLSRARGLVEQLERESLAPAVVGTSTAP